MIFWRIAKHEYANLTGEGGLYGPGRWHHEGRPIVYLADHPALAQLEILVHMDVAPRFLNQYSLIKVEVPDDIKINESRMIGIDITDQRACQEYGSNWLADNHEALHKVRSAIMPESYNYLMNPLHPDAAKIKITQKTRYKMDRRLFI